MKTRIAFFLDGLIILMSIVNLIFNISIATFIYSSILIIAISLGVHNKILSKIEYAEFHRVVLFAPIVSAFIYGLTSYESVYYSDTTYCCLIIFWIIYFLFMYIKGNYNKRLKAKALFINYALGIIVAIFISSNLIGSMNIAFSKKCEIIKTTVTSTNGGAFGTFGIIIEEKEFSFTQLPSDNFEVGDNVEVAKYNCGLGIITLKLL